ncbi:Six-hairpin glycosidase-like protein [Phyllosticta capitalensis]
MVSKRSSLRSTICLVFVALHAFADAGELVVTTDIYPTTLQTNSTSENLPYSDSSFISLSRSNPTTVLDYGTESAGFPFIEVASLSDPGVQIELRYSEGKAYLDEPQADGPWTFSNGLSNTFRVETFNVTEPGRVQSFFIQGGLRWQGIKVLGDASITISRVGLASTSDNTPLDELPGYFESSNDTLNQIWGLGARASQQACVANGSAPSTWEITDEGAFIRGQAPAQSALGPNYSNYTMTFSTKIARGGTGWRVAAAVGGYGPYLVLTSEYPEGTFLNTNRSLLPPNTLVTGFGYSLVNQTTLTTGPVVQYPVDLVIRENEWYSISTSINATGYSVSINGSSPIFVSNANTVPDWETTFGANGDATLGTWGFGPFQDQAAYVKDVSVTASNGTRLYHNAMTSESPTLTEYGVAANTHSVCLDGAKRDRLVWSGDFLHTAFILAHSTGRTDFLSETLAFLLDWRGPEGSIFADLAGMSPKMGSSTQYIAAFADGYGLLDYQFLFLAAAGEFYQHYGADALPALRSHWDELKGVVTAVLPLVNSDSGLISTSDALPGAFFLGAANGTAPSSAFVYALRRMSAVASAIGDNSSAASWTATAATVADAINARLWNPARGTYATDIASFANSSSVSGTAFAILAGVANATQALAAVAALDELRCGVGYKDNSATDCGESTQISPNTNGFLLSAVASVLSSSSSSSEHDSDETTTNTTEASIPFLHLLTSLWPSMLHPSYASGASWEYLTPGLSSAPIPALSAYTSLSHPWGGAPTYMLPSFVLGVRATAPGFREWQVVVPAFEAVRRDLGVSWARGRVPVGGGGSVAVEWMREGEEVEVVKVRVSAPAGTKGRVGVGGREVRGEKIVSVEGGGESVVQFELV